MNNIIKQRKNLESVVVNAAQMQAIESSIFAAGMPIASLMEKAALLTAKRIQELYSPCQVGILVGPGHNGGDALVIARELYLQGYQVAVYAPFTQLKELTSQHYNYAKNLGISCVEKLDLLTDCELIIDGLFGFGLTRNLEGEIATIINTINNWQKPVISIDIPSGIHTDTGEVLGTAIRATYSLCLGLWKLAYFQDQALPYLGKVERIDFGIPPRMVSSILTPHQEESKIFTETIAQQFFPSSNLEIKNQEESQIFTETIAQQFFPSSNLETTNQAKIQIFTETIAQQFFPSPRPLVTHKYQQGHLLLICGSNRYAGGAILTALGARSSGVGMLSVAVPKSLKPLLVNHLPEALIIDCPETDSGAIASLPDLDLTKYSAIACGPGLTLDAKTVVESVLQTNVPLLLDADALNIIAETNCCATVKKRNAATVLTPHSGEFRRLFPHIDLNDRISAVIEASANSGAIVLLKGSRTAIANNEQVYLIPESTPALACGGSGDVLTGLIGGLMAQKRASGDIFAGGVVLGAWWHAQAGILAAAERSDLGVDAFTLAQYLWRISSKISQEVK
jgi:ADP-dependent NAD(P)H-hydrate dehydratase / NAD(P)H-hydrate epimerase